MTIMQTAAADRTYERAVAERDDAARALYRAEVAVHDSRQTHVDEWISAASDRLHSAVTRYLAAEAVVASLRDRTCAA